MYLGDTELNVEGLQKIVGFSLHFLNNLEKRFSSTRVGEKKQQQKAKS